MNESSVLWCLLNHKNTHHIIKQLREEHFSTQIGREIFILSKDLIKQGYKLNLDLIHNNIKASKDFLVPVDVDNYQYYIEKIDDDLFDRVAKGFAYKITSKDQVKKQDFLDYSNTVIRDYVKHISSSNIKESPEIVDAFFKDLDTPQDEITGIKTYIDSLDQKLWGFNPGDYVIIAARPSIGKSAFLSWIACQNALRGNAVLFFSLEMSSRSLISRMFASSVNIPLWKLKTKKFTPADREILDKRKEEFTNMPLIVDETSNLTTMDIEATITEMSNKYDIKLILLDYIQFMMSDNSGNRNNELTQISAQLKQFAKKYKVPFIVASQLSRTCEYRDNKRPQLSDLRDSGALEQDSDIVLMLYRDYYYEYDHENKNLLEVIISKFREGEIGKDVIEYNLDKQYMKTIKRDSELAKAAKKFENIEFNEKKN